MRAYVVLVDIAVLGWSAAALSRLGRDGGAWWLFALLAGIAFGFEEGAARWARLQLRLSAPLKRDTTSVWAVASAVALTPAQAVLLLGSLLAYVWRRQGRHAGQPLYRAWFAASTQMLGCLTASALVHAQSPAWDSLPCALAGSISVLVAISIQTAINRGLITVALAWVGVRGKELIGSWDDNLVELATLCLGGLVALAALHEPWLSILVIAPMITLQRGALVRELETAAATDAKTGLLNAIAWEHLARRELARAAREKYELAILIMDLDYFKRVNDQFGHLAGDDVLRHVGRCLESAVREFDTVGRFGGEEFVVVLPEAGDRDALMIAERLRARINELRVPAIINGPDDGVDDPMSASIGVACSPVDGVEIEDLLRAADAALYKAKARGRNRVVLADRGPEEPVEPAAHS